MSVAGVLRFACSIGCVYPVDCSSRWFGLPVSRLAGHPFAWPAALPADLPAARIASWPAQEWLPGQPASLLTR